MSDDTLTQREYRRLKSRLTRAQNHLKKLKIRIAAGEFERISREAKKLVEDECDKICEEVEYALGIFADKGYPDDWARWTRAKDDALSDKRYAFRHVTG